MLFDRDIFQFMQIYHELVLLHLFTLNAM